MDKKTYEQFFDALEKIVNEDEPAANKAAAIQAWMGEKEDTDLEEFISWFV